MQRGGILNSHIAKVVADMGHTDTIMIADCGLPIPSGVEKIDLAIEFGVPSFVEVVRALAPHFKAEKLFVATEMAQENTALRTALADIYDPKDITWQEVSHAELKKASEHVKAIIRTGEATPYANVILQSGCVFAK